MKQILIIAAFLSLFLSTLPSVAQPAAGEPAPVAVSQAEPVAPVPPPGAELPKTLAAVPPAPVRVNLPEGVPPDQKQVMVSLEMYRIRGDISGNTSLTENLWQGVRSSPKPGEEPFSFFTLADLKVAGVELKADEKGWTWDGNSKPPEGAKVDQLASPRVLVLMGQSFEISIGSQQPIQYFEKRADGLFELKTVPEPTGFSFSGKVSEGGNDDLIVADLDFGLSSIQKRQPIEGVTLDVGLPVIDKQEFSTKLAVKPSQYYGMQLSTQGQGFLILRLRLDAVEPESKPAAP